MKAFLKALAKEGVLSIVVLVILCVLVWFGGSLFADEDNDFVKLRILIIVVLLSIWVTLFIVQKVMAIRNAQKIEAQLKAQAGAHLDGASADQKDIIDEMRQKFDESLSALKKTKGGKSALFTLPWYVIIGPPGSGKTTALQESGLNFPASEAGAKVKGIGGTRNCDWWFTEDGILLDTAGRYTTVADDNKEWLEFLDMIRIGRKTKPINGAIVAMSLDDVLRGSQAEIDQMARDIGNRVAELSAHLNAVFPVYVLFTKADLVKGFVEFFEDFTRDERNQAWGWTFPFGPPDKQYITVFDEKMAELNERIEVRRMELLSTERPDRKKESIYLFPSQMRLAQKKMREFMGALFSANTFQESTILRGVYLTSGTQDGTPIDQILARMNSVLGVEPVAVDESRIEKKSFFIHNLFKKIIFKDKVLARSSSKLVRKRQAIRLVVQGVSVVALALMLWVSVASFVSNKDHINSVEDAAATLSKAKDREKLENLEKLRAALEPLLKHERDGVPLDERWGMYQGENMLKAGARPYLKELSISFTNDVRDNIEKELITSVNRSGDEASKRGFFDMLDLWRAYRMMCGQMEVQPELVVRELQKEFWNKGDSQDSALANRQLAFYAELLEYSNKEGAEIGIFLKPNSEVEAAAKGAIERGGWLDDVYFNYVRKAGQNLSGSRYKKLDPEVPQRLTYRPDVANRFLPHIRAYTQDGWDNYLKEYLDDALTTLRDMHKNLNVAWDEGKMHNRLHKRHAEMIDQVWADYLSSVHLDPTLFDEIDRTAERLERLGQRKDLNIDAMELVKSVEKLRTVKWQNNNVSYSTPAKNVNLKSLDAATGNLGKFIEAFVEYKKATKSNDRFRYIGTEADTDGAKDKLTEFLKSAKKSASEITGDIGPDSSKAVTKLYANLMNDIGGVVAHDVNKELSQRWKDEILDSFKKNIQGKFPFNQDKPDPELIKLGKDISRVLDYVTTDKKYEDADMETVSKLFNPVNGVIEANLSLHRNLAGKTILDTPLFVVPDLMSNFDREYRALQQAIFHNNSKTFNVEFDIRIVHERPATNMRFAVGVKKIGSEGSEKLVQQFVVRNPVTAGKFSTKLKWFYPKTGGGDAKLGATIFIENKNAKDKNNRTQQGQRGDTSRQWELLRLFWYGSNVHRRKVSQKVLDKGNWKTIEKLDIYEFYLPTFKSPLMCSIWVWPFEMKNEPFDVETYKGLGTIDIFNEWGDK